MKKCTVFIFTALMYTTIAYGFVQQKVTPAVQLEAAKGIIQRTTPQVSNAFVLQIIPSEKGNDVFEIESKGGKIVLRGNTGVSLASAYNYYLKHYCFAHVSWCGDQLNLPQPLPTVAKKVRIICPHKYRVYFNYCTLSYTAPWWDWKRWQREIDFMAMNGVNMPLSPVGLEAVWYYTLLDFGFSDAEARAYLVGPNYFAWQWMTNIQSHGGPLPLNWVKKSVTLGQHILTAQRALGMIPIQQGFSGCVPREFQKKFPDSDVVLKSNWCGFLGAAQLDPLDPLFKKFGTAFIKKEIELFGTSHLYATDPFHEGKPPKPGKEYLEKVGATVYKLVDEIDPKSLWVMQAWSIREDIACAVPKDKLLILDLNGGGVNKHKNFWGYNFIRGQLHNFGGRINMHGDLQGIASNPYIKLKKTHENMLGTGLFMEGIIQNPVFYDLYFDMIWRDQPVEIEPWLADYAHRRYGVESRNATAAWKILLKGPYKRGTTGVEKSSIIAARPAIFPKKSGPNAGFSIPYQPIALVEALELLLKDSKTLSASDAYRYDVVDLARQVLSNLGQEFVRDAGTAYYNKDQAAFKRNSTLFLNLLSDLDTLLETREEFRFGKWVNDARRFGATEAEKNLYQKDASMLVTLWGPENNPRIFDYSWREWSGLIKTYYRPRWERFYTFLGKQLEAGGTYDDPPRKSYGRVAFRANDFYKELAEWEIKWVNTPAVFPQKASGNSIEEVLRVFKKYKPYAQKIYADPSRKGMMSAEKKKK